MGMDVYTIGGGEIVYEVLKAVALCLNGGSGTLQAMIRIGGIVGAFVVYYMILYGSPFEVFKKWGAPVLLLSTMLFAPTSTVWIHDTITKYHYKIDAVPYGLALFASQTSKLGSALTQIIEHGFALPEGLTYQKSGMIFGADIMEQAKTFRITNSNFKENFRNFVGQCVKYDIMLNRKYTFDDLKNSNNLWELITRTPSQNRGLYWLPLDGRGSTQYVTCAGAVEKFNEAWKAELDQSFVNLGRKFFTGRFIAMQGSMDPKFTMSPALEEALKQEIKKNLFSIAAYLGGISSSAEDTLKQALIINGIEDAASENAKLSGNAISYAETRAWQHQSTTYETIGRLAAKFLPIMKAVIEAIAYACFIFIIPLCMVPQGYKFLFQWGAVLVWLQAWAPMYAILNYIMNIAVRASTISELGVAGGLTIGNYIGVCDANANIALLAGYLSMSIPFLCIAIVKGVGSFIHVAGQMTGTAMQFATGAAGEVASGNFSFGNINMRNQSYDNTSQLQRNFSSYLAAGGSRLDTGGVQIINDASGLSTYHQDVSSGNIDLSAAHSVTEELKLGVTESEEKARDASVRLAHTRSTAQIEIARIAESVSQLSAHDIRERYGLSSERADSLVKAARCVEAYNKGHTYNDQTNAGGRVGASVGGSVNSNLGAGMQSTNSTNYGDSKQGNTSNEYADSCRILESCAQDIATSERSDELTQYAKEHQHTLQQMNSLSDEKNYHEKKMRSYQDAYSNAASMTVTERNNLHHAAWNIGREQGYSNRESIRIMNSHDKNDKSIRDSWVMEAMQRMGLMKSLQKPLAPQNNDVLQGHSGSDAKLEFEAEYASKEHAERTAINHVTRQVESQRQQIHNNSALVTGAVSDKIDADQADIQQGQPKIQNTVDRIKCTVKERGDTGACVSLGKNVWAQIKDASYSLTGGWLGEKINKDD